MNWHAALAVLGWTGVMILGLFLARVHECKFWRRPENDRRKEPQMFNGYDRRRCDHCPFLTNECKVTRVCPRAEPK